MKLNAEAAEGGNLFELGILIGNDHELTAEERELLLRKLSRELFGDEFSAVLEGILSRHACPPIDFWLDLIPKARDSAFGGAILAALSPYLDLTDLLVRLLASSSAAEPEERKRIALTVWAATCVTTINLQPRDRFCSKENLDSSKISRSIRDNLSHFTTAFDRDSLRRALLALGSG